MKKYYLLSFILLTFSVISCASPIGNDDNQESFLILEGNVLNKEKANIYLFVYDTTICDWQQIEVNKNAKKYSFVLDPTETYQIWFMSDSGYNKILYVDSGDQGLWTANMDINFDKTYQSYAHLYQTCNETYTTYSIDFISKDQAELIPATNCSECDENIDLTSR